MLVFPWGQVVFAPPVSWNTGAFPGRHVFVWLTVWCQRPPGCVLFDLMPESIAFCPTSLKAQLNS